MQSIEIERKGEKQKDASKLFQHDLSGRSSTTTAHLENGVLFHYDLPRCYRWGIIVGALVITCFIGPPYMNWPPLRDMFSAAGAYDNLCDPTLSEVDANGVLSCEAKETAVENLGGFAVSVMFAFTFVAGILLDCFGAKICSCFGVGSMIIGWLIIAFSGTHFNGFKAGIFFMAAGADPGIFGLLSVGNLFPGYNSTVIALIGTARSVAFAIPLVMRPLFFDAGWSLQAVSLAFCGVLITCFLIILFFLPALLYPHLGYGVSLDYEPGENKLSLKEHIKKWPRFSLSAFSRTAKAQFSGWMEQAFSWGYVAFVPIAVITLIRNNFYVQTSRAHIPDAEGFYMIMNPLSFIPCPLMGLIADKIAASLCIYILQTAGYLSMIFGMVTLLEFQYLSVVMNWIFISFVASQFYCYVAATYPQRQMGKLAGFPLLVAGLLSLITEPMNNFTKLGSAEALSMDVLGVIASVLALGLFIYIERPLQKRRQQALIAKSELSSGAEAASSVDIDS